MSDESQTLTPEPVSSTVFMSLEDAFGFAPGATLAESPSDTTPAKTVDTETKTDAAAPTSEPAAIAEPSAKDGQEAKGEPATPMEQGEELAPFHTHPRWIEQQDRLKQLQTQLAEFAPKLEFAQKIESEWGSIEAYNKAVADAATSNREALQSNAEAEIWAEAQALVDSEEMTEAASVRYAQSKIDVLKAQQESAATKAQLAALQPTLQSIEQQRGQAALVAQVNEQYDALLVQYPHMDPDAVYAALYNGVKNPEGFAQRSHERIVSETKKVQEAADARYNEQLKQLRGNTPAPVGATPGMAPAGQARIDPAQRISIADVYNGKYG